MALLFVAEHTQPRARVKEVQQTKKRMRRREEKNTVGEVEGQKEKKKAVYSTVRSSVIEKKKAPFFHFSMKTTTRNSGKQFPIALSSHSRDR